MHKSLLFISGAGVEPSPLILRQFIGLLYQPWMIDADDCGPIRAISEWQRNQSTRSKRAVVPLCPAQITHDLSTGLELWEVRD
jgi:hypothetical protein